VSTFFLFGVAVLVDKMNVDMKDLSELKHEITRVVKSKGNQYASCLKCIWPAAMDVACRHSEDFPFFSCQVVCCIAPQLVTLTQLIRHILAR
jgi:hypothetical protein